VQKVSEEGIDFVMKKGSGTCDRLAEGRPISVLHLQGRYLPGETAEQWRGEGHCMRLELDDLLDKLPHYTITSMVASKRIEEEYGGGLHEEVITDVSRCCCVLYWYIFFHACHSSVHPLFVSLLTDSVIFIIIEPTRHGEQKSRD
jgi:hypothetical protein